MSSPDHRQPPSAGSSDDLKGLDILLVEDSRDVGEAVKKHLELLGAKVAGPAATVAEAEGLLNEHPPDVALVDFHLREVKRSDGLIARLHEQSVPVIMLSGSFEFPRLSSVVGTTFREKPVGEAQLLAHLSPLAAKKGNSGVAVFLIITAPHSKPDRHEPENIFNVIDLFGFLS